MRAVSRKNRILLVVFVRKKLFHYLVNPIRSSQVEHIIRSADCGAEVIEKQQKIV